MSSKKLSASQNESYYIVKSPNNTEQALLVVNGRSQLTEVLGCKVFRDYFGWYWSGLLELLQKWGWKVTETDLREYVEIAETLDNEELAWY